MDILARNVTLPLGAAYVYHKQYDAQQQAERPHHHIRHPQEGVLAAQQRRSRDDEGFRTVEVSHRVVLKQKLCSII